VLALPHPRMLHRLAKGLVQLAAQLDLVLVRRDQSLECRVLVGLLVLLLDTP